MIFQNNIQKKVLELSEKHSIHPIQEENFIDESR